MKKVSKIVTATVASLLVFSSLAFARETNWDNYISYDFTVPATNYATSDAITKQTDSTGLLNDVKYFGWEGSTLYSWVYKNGNISSRTDIEDTGNHYMYLMQSVAKDYKGKTVRLKIKTSTTTMHECDIRGYFYTDV